MTTFPPVGVKGWGWTIVLPFQARKAHDFNLPEHRRISAFIEYLVSMKYKAEDHQVLAEARMQLRCLGITIIYSEFGTDPVYSEIGILN